MSKKNWYFVFSVLGGATICLLYFRYLASPDEQWLIVLLPFFVLILVLVILLAMGGMSVVRGVKPEGEPEEGGDKKDIPPIIFNVPRNTAAVFRNVWHSDPQTLDGYKAKREGWRVWIPVVHQNFEGWVDLTPIQKDTPPVEVNSLDNQLLVIDSQTTYWVSDPVKSTLRVKDAYQLVLQKQTVILNNVSSGKNEEDLTGMNKSELREFSKDITDDLNDVLKDKYGITTEIGIQNIHPPKPVQAAHIRRRAAKIERKAATDEAAAVKKMIKGTGANPTVVFLGQIIADSLRGVFGTLAPTKHKEHKQEEEKK